MTRKARLQTWAAQLNAPVPVDATAAQLEAAIESAISTPAATTTAAGEPQFTLRQGIAANLAVLRSELPSTIRTVAAQFRG
jgi:hypothetical protein